MPGLSGFAATRELLKKLLPTVKVILVTMLTESIFDQRRRFGQEQAATY